MSGSCQCDLCMKKIVRDGFWSASNADHARAAAERAELDYWMEQQVGYDPKKGRPGLDNTVDRPRSLADIGRFLSTTRKRYPRAFGKYSHEKAERPQIPYVESPPELVAERMAKLEAKLADAPLQSD